MAAPKLFLDEDVFEGLAKALRDRGLDAVHAREVGRKGLTDRQQLEFAVSQQRAIFSFNFVDYERLAVACFEEAKGHYGIIVSPQRSFSETLQRLTNLLSRAGPKDLADQLVYL